MAEYTQLPSSTFRNQEEGTGTYRGIPYFASTGLHEAVMGHVEKLRPQIGSSPLALDLGAGRGAFSRRLLDHGFVVEAIELVDTPWQVPEVPVQFVDFCAPSLPSEMVGRYDLIVSLEVIEHIPDPVLFMKNIHHALKAGGTAIVSTPNPINVGTIALMAWKSGMMWFSEEIYRNIHHRNILPNFLLRAFANDAGFRTVSIEYACPAKWPLKLWLSFLPILPAVIWNYLRYSNQWNKLHTLLIATK